jgi:glycosyltransferase involved in cell wall biosynthesis
MQDLKTSVLVLIPAYDEEDRIGSVVDNIKRHDALRDVLVVDDGSSDETRSRAAASGAKVISHPFNLGYGAALQTGYRYALAKGYDLLIQMDGDGQHDPSSLFDLLLPIRRGEADVAIGSRFLHCEEHGSGLPAYEAPLFRKLGMRLFGTIASLLIRQRVTDPTSGYQAMNRRVLEWVSTDRFPFDYPDADVIIMLHRAGFRIREVPVHMFCDPQKKSMHSGWKPVYYIFKMFLSILVTLLRKP